MMTLGFATPGGRCRISGLRYFGGTILELRADIDEEQNANRKFELHRAVGLIGRIDRGAKVLRIEGRAKLGGLRRTESLRACEGSLRLPANTEPGKTAAGPAQEEARRTKVL